MKGLYQRSRTMRVKKIRKRLRKTAYIFAVVGIVCLFTSLIRIISGKNINTTSKNYNETITSSSETDADDSRKADAKKSGIKSSDAKDSDSKPSDARQSHTEASDAGSSGNDPSDTISSDNQTSGNETKHTTDSASSDPQASEEEKEKVMYLTFDDGPSPTNTAKILDILKERNIKATFFVVGENVKKYPELAKRIVDEGHTIGIHCNRHVYDEIYQSVDSYLEDFETAFRTVEDATGVKPVLFRFPGGSINAYNKKIYKDIIKEMTARGFVYFDWNASLDDSLRKTTPEQLVDNAVKTTLGRKRVVMLAHDIVSSTAQCLEDLIDRFPEYRMEPLTPDTAPIQFR